jgi:trans-aconitate methyltransferase
MRDPNLKTTFNSVPTLYEEVRPSYSDALVSDIIAFSQIPEGGSILDIGCGTGKATRPFLSSGYSAVCLDIGEDLIAVAQSALAEFTRVEFVVRPFEEWQTDRTFDLIISATAFHWLNRELRYRKVASLLKTGGCLAVFSHKHVNKEVGFFEAVQEIYRQYIPERSQPVTSSKPQPTSHSEPGLDQFEEFVQKRYAWHATYTAEQYTALLNTYSDHIALGITQRQVLFDGIAEMIRKDFSGQVTKEYETVLKMRKRI